MIQDQVHTIQLKNLYCQAMVQMDLENLKETMINIMNNQQHLTQDQVLMTTNLIMDLASHLAESKDQKLSRIIQDQATTIQWLTKSNLKLQVPELSWTKLTRW